MFGGLYRVGGVSDKGGAFAKEVAVAVCVASFKIEDEMRVRLNRRVVVGKIDAALDRDGTFQVRTAAGQFDFHASIRADEGAVQRAVP